MTLPVPSYWLIDLTTVAMSILLAALLMVIIGIECCALFPRRRR